VDLTFDRSFDRSSRVRYLVPLIFASAVFVFLLSRLWYLQVLRGTDFQNQSENNRIRLREIAPPRGIIFDHTVNRLTDNRPAFNITVVPEDAHDLDTTMERLDHILALDAESKNASRKAIVRGLPFKPVPLKEDVSWEELSAVEAIRYQLPGVCVEADPKRRYIYGPIFAHLIGYLGEISDRELRSADYVRYRAGNRIGQTGLEERWEFALRGHLGGRRVEVDATGRERQEMHEVEPIPGKNLFLTVRLPLQQLCGRAMAGRSGAVVAMDPRDGRILAMYSSPSYDPNYFSRGISQEQWTALLQNPAHPLENKCIQGQYPPGSTFKVITSAAALEMGVITPETVFTCSGTFRFGRRTFRCWKRGGHGSVDLHKAIVESCDVYFYETGLRAGIEAIEEMARRFGLGEATGVHLSGETPGLVPSKAWKRRTFHEPWYEGETVSVSIGQGPITVTPLQVVCLYAAIANGGTLFRPIAVGRVETASGKVVALAQPQMRRSVPLAREIYETLCQGLIGVVNEQHGTGGQALLPEVVVAGKTGTSQVVSMPKDQTEEDEESVPYALRPHAWFAAYAPAEAPEIAGAVLIEHGGHGGSAAAPVARQLIEAYFRR